MKNRKLKIIILLNIIIFSTIILIYGILLKKENTVKKEYISDLAYDENINDINEIYIKEFGEYIPYLVLTNDYDDKTLLLRKNTLETIHKFAYRPNSFQLGSSLDNSDPYFEEVKENVSYNNYYASSYIDDFLNNYYINRYDEKLIDIIQKTEFEVAPERYYYLSKYDKFIESIERKIFLLSYYELSLERHYGGILFQAKEGNKLKYFIDKDAKEEIGNENISYWTRTPSHSSDDYEAFVYVVSDEDYLYSIVNYSNGLRPAFTLNNEIKIKESYDIINDTKVFILDY